MYKDGKSPMKPETPLRNEKDVHDLLKGMKCSNSRGECFLIESNYPASYFYGLISLVALLDIEADTLRNLCGDTKEDIHIKDFVFLDTETTGLSGGAGTVAFLVGLGYFTEEGFTVRQYFMRDYDEEAAMLMEVDELLSKHKGLITFNGKSFDWNLLQGRFIFNRMRPGLRDPLHIDLLHPSRAIWKLKLDSCRLTSLEENILREVRKDDIPGAMIPAVYFKYLEDRSTEDIQKVIKHNGLDIISMVSLLHRIASVIENPIEHSDGEYELLGAGSILEKNGEKDAVLECYELCMKAKSFTVRQNASKKLGMIYKRNKDYSRAVEHWTRMREHTDNLNLQPLIELAKYYEHKERNVIRALEIAEEAQNICSKLGLRESNNADYYFSIRQGLNLTSYTEIKKFGNVIIYEKKNI